MAEDEPRATALDPRWTVLTALTVLLGVESLRALMPLLVFIVRDRFDLGAVAAGLLALAVFAGGFLAAPLRGVLGPRRFLLVAAGGVGLLRLALQLWTGEPLVDLGLAIGATSLFLLSLPALVAGRGASAPSFGVVLGLAADAAFHGLYGTWDMSWRSDLVTAAVVLALVLAQWRLLSAALPGAGAGAGDVPWRLAWTWGAVGPFLFLVLLVLGNVARLAALSGWPPEAAAAWTVAGWLLAAGAVAGLVRRRVPRGLAVALAAALTALLAVPWPTGIASALQLTAGQALSAALLSLILRAAPGRAAPGRAAPGRAAPGRAAPGRAAPGRAAPGRAAPGRAAPGFGRLATAHGLGLIALAALFFLYYGGVDLRLPLAKDVLPPLAAALLGAAAVAAVREAPAAVPRPGLGWLGAAALLLLPLGRLATAPEVRPGDAAGFPLRVMTYNLHCAVDPRGHLGLEAIAAAIEAEEPDVVALQEVSRGWVVNGSVDAMAWLSRRLAMPYVFAPTADPLWGNALLSRRPIAEHRAYDLPPEDLLIRRGFLAARVDLGADGHLEAVVTHLHHPSGGGEVREAQARALVDFWQGRPRTAILGDLNARPGEPEIETLRRAGLADVLDLGGVTPGYTHSALAPTKRIDYVWISPDLAVRDAAVPPVPASDHLPVVATLELR